MAIKKIKGTSAKDLLEGRNGPELILGLGGNDKLYGNGGNDRLEGGTGNDLLDGGLGNDAMIGGAGNDVFVVGETGDKVSEKTGGGLDTVRASIAIVLSIGHSAKPSHRSLPTKPGHARTPRSNGPLVAMKARSSDI